MCVGLANSLYVRRIPGENKVRRKRKGKEHFLTSGHGAVHSHINMSITSCFCVVGMEPLMYVQDHDAKNCPGW